MDALHWQYDTAAPPAQLRYDAAETSSRRRQPPATIRSTDQLLTPTRRTRLISSARDMEQNYSVAAWAIRRHLDYVTSFSFQPATGDEALDDQLAELVDQWSTPDNCEVSGRFDLPALLRLAEARRTVDGDIFLIKLSDGRLQPLEADLIRDPPDAAFKSRKRPEHLYHGIHTTPTRRPIRYAAHRRKGTSGYEFVRWVSAQYVFPLQYLTQFDQVRGVSPLAAALNPLRDVYEGWEYAVAKMKVSQLFGLAIYRQLTDADDPLVREADDETAATSERYEVDFGRGPVKLELEPGDRAEFLESKTPSTEFRDFSITLISAAIKALDIPFSFFDEAYTNFYGSRAAAMQYDRACAHKRRDLQRLLNAITRWNIARWQLEGRISIPARLARQDQTYWEWIPAGTPWWRPLEETKADIAAIQAGFKTHDEVVRQRTGRSFRANIDQIAAEFDYAARNGVSLITASKIQPSE